jgi:hypothetical protein
MYSVRKKLGEWTICFDDTVVMRFSSYEEALSIAKAAADVLVERERQKTLILRDIHACAQAGASRPTV